MATAMHYASTRAALEQVRREVIARGAESGFIIDPHSVETHWSDEYRAIVASYLSHSGPRWLSIPDNKLGDRWEIYEKNFPMQWADPVH